jgi:hypothetical protein
MYVVGSSPSHAITMQPKLQALACSMPMIEALFVVKNVDDKQSTQSSDL